MGDLAKKSNEVFRQCAALPFRSSDSGTEVMLVTSRRTRRWIIPKGSPIAPELPHASAGREAFEEAGLVGTVGRNSIGTYFYQQRLRGGPAVTYEVLVFPLEVVRQENDWLEREERELRWFSPDDAANAVQEPALREIILNIRSLLKASF